MKRMKKTTAVELWQKDYSDYATNQNTLKNLVAYNEGYREVMSQYFQLVLGRKIKSKEQSLEAISKLSDEIKLEVGGETHNLNG